jgi:hypothetical protein
MRLLRDAFLDIVRVANHRIALEEAYMARMGSLGRVTTGVWTRAHRSLQLQAFEAWFRATRATKRAKKDAAMRLMVYITTMTNKRFLYYKYHSFKATREYAHLQKLRVRPQRKIIP